MDLFGNTIDWKQQYVESSIVASNFSLMNLLIKKGIITEEEVEQEENTFLDEHPDIAKTLHHAETMMKFTELCRRNDFTEEDEKMIKEDLSKYYNEEIISSTLEQFMNRRNKKEES